MTTLESPVQAAAQPRAWKTPLSLAVIAVLALLLFTLLGRDGVTALRIAATPDGAEAMPDIMVPARPFAIVAAVVGVVLAGVAVWRSWQRERVPVWLTALFAVVLVLGFVVWASVGAVMPLPGLLAGAVSLAVPLTFGALGGVISERSGVVNVAIEAQLLGGAFAAAVIASVTRQPLLGLVAAAVAGVLVSLVLAVFAIRYWVDQVIVGVVLNVLVAGLTNFLFRAVLEETEGLNRPVGFDRIRVPVLADIPIIGPALFNQTLIVYIAFIAVPVLTWCMFRTTWGLRLRALGEHPLAADTVGIAVNRSRFLNVSLAGAIAGAGGAYFTLDLSGSFGREMTNGLGFIALAAVIFGQWHPVKATAAAFLFGFTSSLQQQLKTIGSSVPDVFMLMLPYVVTLLAVAGFIGRSRPPAASGKPYVKS